jgi:GntR family transcriptional regulator/MocR family aminotransferase
VYLFFWRPIKTQDTSKTRTGSVHARPEYKQIRAIGSTAAEPLYRQIYERFRNAIASGLLKPGDRIPSARALTKELGLARGTIETAYSLLAAEGYIQARGQAGTL